MTNMLKTEVDTFLYVTISDDFMNDNADSRLGDVVHDSSTSSEIIINDGTYLTIIETHPW